MRWASVLVACFIAGTGAPAAHADVWKVALADARRDVHYLVQMLNRDPKVFGWISGDEQALLRKHGIVEGQ